MHSELQRLTERDQAFVLVSALLAGNQSSHFLEYLPPPRAADLQPILESLLQSSAEDLSASLKETLEALQGTGKQSLFYQADPQWIVETFKGESPQVMALILEALPKATVGGVLKDLPKETRKSLKNVSTRKVPLSIRSLVKKKVESRFPLFRMELLEKDEVLQKLSGVKLGELNEVLRELGISEMALAFSRVQRAAVRAILNRLKTSDAKELQSRIKQGTAAGVKEQREAQLQILSLDFEKLEPEEIVQEIGFGVLSRAFGKEDLEVATFFVYKFPPHSGYLLKRLVDMNAPQNTPEKARKIRERVLDAYTRVAASR